jgi:hypothetical protein
MGIFRVKVEDNFIDSNFEVIAPRTLSGSHAGTRLRIGAPRLSKERKDQYPAENP